MANFTSLTLVVGKHDITIIQLRIYDKLAKQKNIRPEKLSFTPILCTKLQHNTLTVCKQ